MVYSSHNSLFLRCFSFLKFIIFLYSCNKVQISEAWTNLPLQLELICFNWFIRIYVWFPFKLVPVKSVELAILEFSLQLEVNQWNKKVFVSCVYKLSSLSVDWFASGWNSFWKPSNQNKPIITGTTTAPSNVRNKNCC